MDINKTLGKSATVVVIVLIVLLPFVYSVVRSVFAQSAQSSELFLEKAVVGNADGGDTSKCVIEAKFGLDARYQHMDFLKAIREDAMRAGKRGEVSIKSCQQCHQNRESFCSQCHRAVNLDLDAGCFRCHYYPGRTQPSP